MADNGWNSLATLSRILGELSERTRGLEVVGRLPLRIRERSTRSSINSPASGAAVTTVPKDALGAGEGLVVRKSG